MILLFEEYNYPQPIIEEALEGYTHLLTTLKDNKAKVQCVGYFYSVEKEDSVFILPKVFIKEIKYIDAVDDKEKKRFLAFGRYNPEKIIYIQDGIQNEDIINLSKRGDRAVVFELSVWIYRAIAQFVNRKGSENVVNDIVIQNPISANGEKSQTLLDTILQLLDFHKKHRNLFTYISIVNSSGNNKIHWAKTISKTRPIVKDNNPYYIEFKNKSKVFNFDEELIVLFYSTLAYLSDTYYFRVKSDVQYKLLPTHKIKDLIDYEGGTRLLKRIRRKYFTDELVKLWKLLFAFFEKAEQIESHKCHEDRLLVKNFNLVFEDMIDYLIGSEVDKDVPSVLKNQPDGKIVDHIYKGRSLIDDSEIYYVGDSKYYSDDSKVGEYSIYKQFTYAKNIIQLNINLLDDEWKPCIDSNYGLRYRDKLTEGYNITPNFFIRGEVDSDNITYAETIESRKDTIWNRHFHNRLFDRDTLILREYNINFLYVLSAYAINIESNNRTHRLRTKFRNDLLVALDSAYSFFKVKPKNTSASLEDVVRNYFYDFNGRMYISQNDSVIWVALEKGKEHGIDGDKRYPSISSFEAMCVVSERLALCERDSEYGCKEKYFGEPIWNKPIGYTVALNEGGMMAAEDMSAYSTNLNN